MMADLTQHSQNGEGVEVRAREVLARYIGFPAPADTNSVIAAMLDFAALSRAAPSSDHSDDAAVDRFAAQMKAKLAKARAKGRGGWDDPAQCSTDHLRRLLHDHLPKGDPIDVANFSMMLAHYGASTAAPSSEPAIAEGESNG